MDSRKRRRKKKRGGGGDGEGKRKGRKGETLLLTLQDARRIWLQVNIDGMKRTEAMSTQH